MNHQLGEYAKVIGGDFGIFWDGKSWKSFECLGCMIASNLVIPSHRVPWTTKHGMLYRKSIQRNLKVSLEHRVPCNKLGALHDYKHVEHLHREWLEKGKPYKKDE